VYAPTVIMAATPSAAAAPATSAAAAPAKSAAAPDSSWQATGIPPYLGPWNAIVVPQKKRLEEWEVVPVNATQPAESVAEAAATPAPIAREEYIGRGDLISVTFRIEYSRRILEMLMRVTDVSLDSTRGIQTVCVEEALGIESWYADCKGWLSLNLSGNLEPADGQFFPCYQVKYTILKVERLEDRIAKARLRANKS